MYYNIIVKNASNCIIDDTTIKADNENKALIEYLQNNTIYDGDTIIIVEGDEQPFPKWGSV